VILELPSNAGAECFSYRRLILDEYCSSKFLDAWVSSSKDSSCAGI